MIFELFQKAFGETCLGLEHLGLLLWVNKMLKHLRVLLFIDFADLFYLLGLWIREDGLGRMFGLLVH